MPWTAGPRRLPQAHGKQYPRRIPRVRPDIAAKLATTHGNRAKHVLHFSRAQWSKVAWPLRSTKAVGRGIRRSGPRLASVGLWGEAVVQLGIRFDAPVVRAWHVDLADRLPAVPGIDVRLRHEPDGYDRDSRRLDRHMTLARRLHGQKPRNLAPADEAAIARASGPGHRPADLVINDDSRMSPRFWRPADRHGDRVPDPTRTRAVPRTAGEPPP